MRLKIELRCILSPSILLEMFLQLDWSPSVVNSIDWTLFGKAHTCLYKVPQVTVPGRAMRSKEPAQERRGPQTGAKVHLPTGQRPYAYSQDNAGVALGQVSECPWGAQPESGLEPDQTSLERPEKKLCSNATHPIWQSLKGTAEKNRRNSTNTGMPSL